MILKEVIMNIGNKKIGKDHPVYIIAEAGINHNGDLDIAKEMIEEAKKCGVDAIKIQTIIPEDLFSQKLNPELFEMCKDWTLDLNQHKELKKHAIKNKIEFFSTPVGLKSTKILRDLGVSAIKIASGDLNNYELIKEASKSTKSLIISTGMSSISEIMSTVNFIEATDSKFMLLHCISSYPASIKDANLNTIPYFKTIFNVPIGYSDHTLGIDTAVTAVALGASCIEKHFTLDKKMIGPDQNLSANPHEFKELVAKIRLVENGLGTPRNTTLPSEIKFRKLMRRSIFSTRDLKKGTKLNKSDLILLRPGNGIHPKMIENLIGMTLIKNVKKGEMLSWKMF